MIDAHLHFWNPEHLTYDWLQYVPSISGRMGPAELAGAGVDIESAIFIQADCAEALAEVDWINSLNFPILGIVAYAPLEIGDTPHITALKAKPNVVGIRRNAQNEPDGFMTSEGYLAGMIAAAQAGFSLDMCIRARQLPELRQALTHLFGAVPDARVILDHLGKPDIRTHRVDIQSNDWANEINALSDMPNVFCKLSGLPTEADWENWTPEQLRPWLDHALKAFGPSRCLFGGDWPVVDLAGGYSRWQAVVTAALSHLTADEQEQVWSRTARRVYCV
ncbi:amidohydrolase family protein [Asticcacaulis sp.]|uniref:amidohydrolase family protein n=1 Tax=Asticcacaulis sp. TaxID=1872648 RepID=UPI002BDD36C9|nr:amidohydrolase family protein [Asticcacaulis sp.]HTM82973.1 amidohydrolase family protein [Asticcacaulis sp.]